MSNWVYLGLAVIPIAAIALVFWGALRATDKARKKREEQ